MHGSAAGTPVPLSTLGGLVTLASPDSLPEGASPRCHDNDYLVGSTGTRSGLTSVFPPEGTVGTGPNAPVLASGSAWNNPSATLSNGSTYASIEATASASGALSVTEFGFSLGSDDTVQGIPFSVYGYSDSYVQLTAQLVLNGVAIGTAKTVTMPNTPGTISFGALTDMWGAGLTRDMVNNEAFGVQLTVTSTFLNAHAFIKFAQLTIGITSGNANFNFLTTFTAQNGNVKNLYLDANGDFWVQDVTNAPTTLSLSFEGVTPGSYAVGVNGPDVEYLAFNDLSAGSDIPRQYTANWVDRISQVGPGAAPVFTPTSATSDTFAISSITQPAAAQDPYGDNFYGGIYYLQSSGPGSTAPGNVVTIYYGDTGAGCPQNADLAAAMNTGYPVLLYLSITGTPTTFGPLTVQVTSIGLAKPPGQPREFYYLTFQVTNQGYVYYQGSGHPSYEVAWTRTLASLNMAVPVPGLMVGNQVTISGCTPLAWNAQWTISQALNSGSMVITQTSVSSGVATYSYALSSGVAPAAGELVTVTNTTNANGALNVINATIQTASGGSTGSFTVNVSAPDASAASESGQATTAGTQFAFDPGIATLGTSTNPIYGNTTVAGTITFGGASGQFIGTGTRQGTVFFITRNGYWTMPAPPAIFTVPSNTTALVVSNIPLGPANVIARGIAITEAGQNGVPGGNFYCTPQPVNYTVSGQTYTSSSFIVNDNVSTSASLFFTDNVLLQQSEAVDGYGFNLFNLVEIGDPGWIVQYSSRNFYGLCKNKIQNFNNLSFDGGYLPATQKIPLGWSNPGPYGSLLTSPVFGNSYYISNTGSQLAITATAMTSGTATYTFVLSSGATPVVGETVTVTGTTNGSGVFNVTNATIATVSGNQFTVTGLSGTFTSQAETGLGVVTGTLATAGLISQGAYQDAYQVPIIQPNTKYSVRVNCRAPSGLTTGSLVISLAAGAVTYGSYTLPFASMTSFMKQYTGTLLTAEFTNVPTDLTLTLQATGIGTGADVEIDRVEVYDTAIPVLKTVVFGSYANDFESVDGVTGRVDFISENQEPVYGAKVLYDTFYALKESSMYSLRASANLEPAQWDEPEVAQKAGACGPLAYDSGEQWLVTACRNGVYLYEGGQPGKIMQEIFQVWNALNWNAGNCIWVKNDVVNRRLFIGVPLPTPNFWLPDAPTNATPTTPNVMLMMNYQGLETAQEIKSYPQMHTTMFGTLNAIDMRRKWSIWQIAAPYAAFVQTQDDQQFYIGNGAANSRIYKLDANATTDDGTAIDSLYTTAGMVTLSKAQENPMLGLFRKRWGYMTLNASGSGIADVTLYPNQLLGPGDSTAGYYPWKVPGGFTLAPVCFNDHEATLNFVATRTFVELRGADWTCSAMTLYGRKDVWNALRGVK